MELYRIYGSRKDTALFYDKLINPEIVRGLPEIRKFKAQSCVLDWGTADALSRLPGLRRLSLDICHLMDNTTAMLTNGNFEQLRFTDWSSCDLRMCYDTIASSLAANTTLTALRLGDAVTAKGASALASSTSLQVLRLDGNRLHDEGAYALSLNTTLYVLDISSNRVGDEGAKALALNTTLRELNVGYNLIWSSGTAALASNQTLKLLHMEHNKCGMEGARAFALNTSLKELCLENNSVSDAQLTALAYNSTLNTLLLANEFVTASDSNSVSHEGLAKLCKNPSLTWISISDPADSADLEAFRETMKEWWNTRRNNKKRPRVVFYLFLKTLEALRYHKRSFN